MIAEPCLVSSGPSPGAALLDALSRCEKARASSRILDGYIAIAVFPGLVALRQIEEAVWRDGDGARVRALRYSSSNSAAMTLVPAGHWIEAGPCGFAVIGPNGRWFGGHDIEAIAICLAALRSRVPGFSDAC